MPSINRTDLDEFFKGFSAKFNPEKLAGAFPTAEEQDALRALSAKLAAAIQKNNDAEKVWQTLGDAKSVALKLLKLAI